ncbi:MAG: sigma-70 family RNA polymerase sigma factor [Bacteroidia bacterium]|nr:sigma-70 family RNA polymerase sigma factor [Bacteroidia bacterium]
MSKSLCQENHFKSIFLAHSQELRNFMYYKSGNLEMAEDLVQEAFGKLWENCAKVLYEKARSYLYVVMNNLFLNQVAHQKVVLKFEQRQKSDSYEQSPQFILEGKEFKERLTQAISDLPEKQRVVFLMNRIDRKTYREIAEILGISVKAVEKRMHVALSSLKKIHPKI